MYEDDISMGDMGVRQGGDYEEDDYEAFYPKDITVGELMEGEVYMTDMKETPEEGTPFFMIIVTNHDAEKKWLLSYFNPSIYTNEGKPDVLYGKKDGKIYVLIDSLLSKLFKDVEAGTSPDWTVEFDKFRETINNKIQSVKVEAVQSSHFAAKNPNFKVVSVEKLN
jgi:hypothetical protein